MFISRIALNKARYGARQLISSPYKLHAAVECAFPPNAVRNNDEGRILWRLDTSVADNGVWLYVVSPEKPDFMHIVEQAGWPMHAEWETKNYEPLLERIAKGQRWHLQLARIQSERQKKIGGGGAGTAESLARCKATLPLISSCSG